MIFTKEELNSYSEIQLNVLADYLKLEHEGDGKEKLIEKITAKVSSVNTVYELWEETPPRSVQVQRIYDSQKEVENGA